MTREELQAAIDLSHQQLDAFAQDNLAADRAIVSGSVAGLIATHAKSAREAIGIEDDEHPQPASE